jgi:hypothetical protein
MGIVLIITLTLMVYICYIVANLQQKLYELEDHIHAIHHDMDMKIEDIKENGYEKKD